MLRFRAFLDSASLREPGDISTPGPTNKSVKELSTRKLKVKSTKVAETDCHSMGVASQSSTATQAQMVLREELARMDKERQDIKDALRRLEEPETDGRLSHTAAGSREAKPAVVDPSVQSVHCIKKEKVAGSSGSISPGRMEDDYNTAEYDV